MRTISLLEMLSESELTRLGKYLKSPFFTNKKHLYPLFLELRRAGHKAAQGPEARFAKVFPGKPFNNHRWNKALSDLNACIEDFLVVSHLKADRELYDQALVSAFSKRVNESGLQQAVGSVLKQLPGHDAPEQMDRWHLRFWSRKRAITHPQTDRIKLGADALDELEQDLETYYYISKTQLMCNRASGIKIRNWPRKMMPIQTWLKVVRAETAKRPSVLLKVYCDVLDLFLNVGFDLSNFFSNLQQYGPNLHPDELRDAIRLAFSECTYRQRQGNPTAFHWHLEIFQWSDKQGLWDAHAAEELYLNIGVMLIKANLPDKFKKLYAISSESIPAERREEAKNLLWAYWDFAHGNYAKAEVNLSRISTRHPRYVLLRHSIAVRNACMLFQQGAMNDDAVERVLITFNNFLRYPKNPFSKDVRQPYHNLIGFIRRIIQTDTNQRGIKAALRQFISAQPPAARDWVEEIMATLPD